MIEDRFDLTTKVAVVTGAGSVGSGFGNGKATSVLLAQKGASVLAVDVSEDRAAETREIIRKNGGECTSLAADVTHPDGAALIAREVIARYGRADILVNNVGGSEPGDSHSMPADTWRRQLDFNLTSVFLVSQSMIPLLLKQPTSALVNLGSIAGLRYFGRDHIAYAAAKAGVVEFTRQTALRYAKEGLRCNTVIPGLLHTPLVEARLAGQYAGGNAAAIIQARNAQIPMGKAGDAWDVAYAVLYLVSAASGHVTGTEIVVDGGMSAATIPYQLNPQSS
jgi:NAD(P)-dependent dehydrogenase (short-subunit alcohol dehydrogenase family)